MGTSINNVTFFFFFPVYRGAREGRTSEVQCSWRAVWKGAPAGWYRQLYSGGSGGLSVRSWHRFGWCGRLIVCVVCWCSVGPWGFSPPPSLPFPPPAPFFVFSCFSRLSDFGYFTLVWLHFLVNIAWCLRWYGRMIRIGFMSFPVRGIAGAEDCWCTIFSFFEGKGATCLKWYVVVLDKWTCCTLSRGV